MLTRFYVDNFRCLSNFEWKPEQVNLLLGPNGSGKSSIFSALRRVRDFVLGDETSVTAFPCLTLTRWETRVVQTIEIDLAANGGIYRYTLRLQHEPDRSRNRIDEETLKFNDSLLFSSDGREAQLYRDNGSIGPKVLCDWIRSGVGIVQSRPDNTILTQFREHLRKFWIMRIVPSSLQLRSQSEDEMPARDFSNFSSWLRHHQGANEEGYFSFRQRLGSEVIPGFRSFKQMPVGENEKEIVLEMAANDQTANATEARPPFSIRISDLSDGQRVLLCLYALLELAPKSAILCLDEPENFLALPEVSVWLQEIVAEADVGRFQLALISHHPRLVDFLAAHSGYWCERTENGPMRIKKVDPLQSNAGGLPISELVARGWLE